MKWELSVDLALLEEELRTRKASRFTEAQKVFVCGVDHHGLFFTMFGSKSGHHPSENAPPAPTPPTAVKHLVRPIRDRQAPIKLHLARCRGNLMVDTSIQ